MEKFCFCKRISEPIDHEMIDNILRKLQKEGKELDDQILELTKLVQVIQFFLSFKSSI